MTSDDQGVDDSDSFLEGQLRATRLAWKRLVAHGVDHETLVRLDFAYVARSIGAANRLREFLQDETDYAVRVSGNEDRWIVEGRTRQTRLDQETLEQWVDWMISAGDEADCTFDGWGAEVA